VANRDVSSIESRPPVHAWRAVAWLTLAIAASSTGCRLTPSNDRDWAPEYSRVATANFRGDLVTIHNVRNCDYRSQDEFDVHYSDRTYDLTKVDSVDYILVPFADMPSVAHTFLSFGFQGDNYLSVSVEVRHLRGEKYTPIRDLFNQSEIVYVVGDERDLIRLRSNFRKDDVYLYRANTTPGESQALFVDMLQRANKLASQPEFYNTITNNCTTNIVTHVNHVIPNKIPYSYQVLFPGLSDRLAYNLGLIKGNGTFEQTRAEARINRVAYIYRDSPDFSQRIRRY
jgi:hypothetical protein